MPLRLRDIFRFPAKSTPPTPSTSLTSKMRRHDTALPLTSIYREHPVIKGKGKFPTGHPQRVARMVKVVLEDPEMAATDEARKIRELLVVIEEARAAVARRCSIRDDEVSVLKTEAENSVIEQSIAGPPDNHIFYSDPPEITAARIMEIMNSNYLATTSASAAIQMHALNLYDRLQEKLAEEEGLSSDSESLDTLPKPNKPTEVQVLGVKVAGAKDRNEKWVQEYDGTGSVWIESPKIYSALMETMERWREGGKHRMCFGRTGLKIDGTIYGIQLSFYSNDAEKVSTNVPETLCIVFRNYITHKRFNLVISIAGENELLFGGWEPINNSPSEADWEEARMLGEEIALRDIQQIVGIADTRAMREKVRREQRPESILEESSPSSF